MFGYTNTCSRSLIATFIRIFLQKNKNAEFAPNTHTQLRVIFLEKIFSKNKKF